MSRTPVFRSAVPGAVLTSLLAIACAAALTACGGGGPSPSGTTGPGTANSGPPGVATRTGGVPQQLTYPNTAEDYAKVAVAAWAARDLERLDQLEVSDGALHKLYACNGCYDTAFTLVGCSGAAGSTGCTFYNKVGDSLILMLSNPAIGQARAIGTGSIWNPITFPSATRAYAQEALDAWPVGNDNRLALLTSKPFTSAQISALGADRTAAWTYAGAQGVPGSTYEQWTDGAGDTIGFRFRNGPGPAPTTGPTSQHRIQDIVFLPA